MKTGLNENAALGDKDIHAVSTESVSFKSSGLSIAAVLYLPEGIAFPAAAIVVGHPGSGVKEQTAGVYAGMLAERGFIALTFDAAYQGESEGLPRGLEDPAQRVEDFKGAVSFLSTLAFVDAQRIGLFGMCASGGYVIPAGVSDHRVKAVATVIAADISRQFRMGGDGSQDPAVIAHMLDAAAADRTAVAKGAEPGSFALFPADAEQARAMGDHVYQGWEYYNTERGQHPRSAKTLTWSSVDKIVTFDAFRFIGQLSPRPLLMVSGSKAATLWMTREAFGAAAEPKELLVIEGASHMDLYDNMVYVSQAVEKVAEFFGREL